MYRWSKGNPNWSSLTPAEVEAQMIKLVRQTTMTIADRYNAAYYEGKNGELTKVDFEQIPAMRQRNLLKANQVPPEGAKLARP